MNDTFLYRQSLRFSWRLVWEHKLLWVFGLFAAFLGHMGMTEIVGKVLSVSESYSSFGPVDLLLSIFSLPSLVSFSFQEWTAYIWLLLLLGIVFFGIFAIAVISQGVLIHVVAQHPVVSKKQGIVNIDHAWHAGVSHFWKLLLLHILKRGTILVLTVLVGIATANAVVSSSLVDTSIFLGILLLSLAIGFVLSSLVIYAAGYVVIEEYPIKKAIIEAWYLFKEHWFVSLEVGLLMTLLNVCLFFVILLAFFIVYLHGTFVWVLSFFVHSFAAVEPLLFVEYLLFVAFVLFAGSAFTVFSTSVWSYLFMHMHRTGITSHLTKLFHK